MASMKRLTPLLFACMALLATAPVAGADVREIGQPVPFQAASCPDNCQAIAQVSGYNAEIGKSKNTFRINRPGRVVAFTIRLGQPNADQLNYFKTTFGAISQARVSILKPAKTKQRHRLVAQSELFNLEPYFGTTPTFALEKSLAVHKGEIIGITVPTWAPAFAHGLTNDFAWRSSSHDKDCTSATPPPAAQMTLGSLRIFGCFYRTARLLYSVHYVLDPTPKTPPKAK
ncbi:MAG: hypothetical protein QOE06_1589 [Thermoleophilaceae bacterium]|jgi:hypothetical protein|nr:hypothetical protein [Thermoleophilaceae bacterium]